MDRTIAVCVWLLLLVGGGEALKTRMHEKMRMQVTARQDLNEDVDSDILFYISDEDQNNQVAVDFPDAVDYAESSLVVPPTAPSPPTSPFMTGDIFDNDLSDETKLYINSVQAAEDQLVIVDLDDGAVDIPEMQEDMDEDPEAVSVPFSDMMGDLDDARWNPVSDLRVITSSRGMVPLTWGPEDLDDSVVGEADGEVAIGKGDVQQLTARTPTSEFVFDLDEEAVDIAGVRYVQSDVNGVPLFYGGDSSDTMQGDMYDNGRSDNRPLLTRVEEAENPLQWVRVARTNPILPDLVVEEDFDEVMIEEVNGQEDLAEIQETKDVDDLEEIDTVFEPIDIEVLDSDDGGDLDDLSVSLTQPDSDFMVGDLFDNTRTDQSKLTIVGQTAENPLDWPMNDIDDLLEAQKEEMMAAGPEQLEVDLETSEDLDDVSNLYVTPETSYTDVDEFIVPEAIIEESRLEDADEVKQDGLGFESPLKYMNGDLFDNRRSDSSLLRVENLRGDGVEWTEVDADDVIVYDLNASDVQLPVDEDDAITPTTTYEVNYQEFKDLDEISGPPLESASSLLTSGNRLTFFDNDDVPTFFSEDQSDYLSGDFFNNERSDSSQLTIMRETGRNTQWSDIDDYTDRRNPGFLQ